MSETLVMPEFLNGTTAGNVWQQLADLDDSKRTGNVVTLSAAEAKKYDLATLKAFGGCDFTGEEPVTVTLVTNEPVVEDAPAAPIGPVTAATKETEFAMRGEVREDEPRRERRSR